MMEITAEIRALIDKAAADMELAGDEYIDPADGLIHCKKCGGQRQTVVPRFGKPGYFMPRFLSGKVKASCRKRADFLCMKFHTFQKTIPFCRFRQNGIVCCLTHFITLIQFQMPRL